MWNVLDDLLIVIGLIVARHGALKQPVIALRIEKPCLVKARLLELMIDIRGYHEIVLENKIKSGINGIGNKKNGKYESQLSKYIEELTNPNKKEEKKQRKRKSKKQEVNREDIICFLLHPQYMQFNLDSFEKGEEYNKVSFKDLYELFVHHQASIKEEDQLFFKLMLDALRKHTKDRDADIEERKLQA